MRALFLHQNFPGQFVHVVRALRARGDEVVAITDKTNARPDIVPTRRYAFDGRTAQNSHRLAAHFALRAARGETVAGEMLKLREEGFAPDIVVGHPGWGETLFVKDVWPKTRLVVHAEFYYAAEGADMNFDPEFGSSTMDERLRTRTKNAAMLAALADAEFGIAPTAWQASCFPKELRGKIAVMHEGIDTNLIKPNPAATIRLGKGALTLKPGDEVVTFINRNLEPYRGYHIFMRALPQILAARPNAHAVIIGGDDVSYGARPKSGTWKQIYLDEVKVRLPPGRVHFVGKVPYPVFIELMQVTAAHVYLTYPFVLSWSMLEAMSAGALVIGSSTPPVTEMIEDGKNGVLVDFFDVEGFAAHTIAALAEPEKFKPLRAAARQTIVERFDLKRVCLPKWVSFVDAVAKQGSA